ncbi:MAG: amidohydrolase [Okeania sp. SIO2C2]|nr:amidohydrolase [Okeania sp. SIO2C2]
MLTRLKPWLSTVMVAIVATIAVALASTSPSWAGQIGVRMSPATSQPGEKPAYIGKVIELVDEYSDELIETFKDIHRHPELGFEEEQTAAIVAAELEELGYEVKKDIAETGVVGILENGEGPTVMFRADMDANAVEEETDLDYASEVPGVMHACGHDAHTTWMLGLAKLMKDMESYWSGTLVLVAQPAEELIEGAQAMIDDGLYEPEDEGGYDVPVPQFLLAAHTAPGPTGYVANLPGTRMAGTNQFDVTFKGIGGHGSTPELAKDPIVMTAAAIMEYQAIVSRAISPLEAAVITVGSVQAGIDPNVIPETSLLRINLRWFSEEVKDTMIAGIKRINESIAYAYGLREDLFPEIEYGGESTPLVNDEELVEKINPHLEELLGGEDWLISDMPPSTGSEDVHLLKGDNDEIEVDFAFIGIADPALFEAAIAEGKSVPFANHNPEFQVDLDAIPLGAKIVSVMTLATFNQ